MNDQHNYSSYPAPPSQPPYGYPPQAQVVHHHYNSGRTSGLAIASLVLGIVWVYWIGSILAVIFGHVALGQMKTDPSLRGRGMAIAGLVLGYIGVAIIALIVLVAIGASA